MPATTKLPCLPIHSDVGDIYSANLRVSHDLSILCLSPFHLSSIYFCARMLARHRVCSHAMMRPRLAEKTVYDEGKPRLRMNRVRTTDGKATARFIRKMTTQLIFRDITAFTPWPVNLKSSHLGENKVINQNENKNLHTAEL
jgi:hypothetical protein